jgi:competence protein ComGF
MGEKTPLLISRVRGQADIRYFLLYALCVVACLLLSLNLLIPPDLYKLVSSERRSILQFMFSLICDVLITACWSPLDPVL